MAEARLVLQQLTSHVILVLLVFLLAFPSRAFTADNTLTLRANAAEPIVVPPSRVWY